MCLWIFYCAFFPKQWNNLFNLCSVCKLCHNLNSLVVLYLEFCAWFNMKGELGESLPKQKRYFNWYISIHYARKNVFENIFKLNLRLTKGGCSQTFLPFLFSLYWTILSWRWRAGRVKSHHKFWQKHTFYICIVSWWSVSSNHTEAPDRLSHFTLSKFWVLDKKNGTKVFMLKMWSHIHMKMIFNDFEIICWEILELFTDKVH